MKKLLATTMLAGGLMASPAFAQMSSEDMSCADFVAMDSSGQMEAMKSMAGGMASDAMKSSDMASDAMKSGDMKSGDMASGDMDVTADDVVSACADHPDMMVHDAVEQAKMAK
jgi:hypothetical protein